MSSKNQRNNMEWALTELDLNHVVDRDVDVLSGNERLVSGSHPMKGRSMKSFIVDCMCIVFHSA
jgi:hypothetical protein